MCFLSIVTVHFNEFEGLAQTMESFLELRDRFDHIGMEWVVVDGGSDFSGFPGLRGRIESVSAAFLSEKDRGLYDAMNKGLGLASGRYCIFMNAGDRFTQDFDLAELASLAQSTPALIMGAAYEAHPGQQPFLKLPRGVGTLWYGMPTHHQAMVMRTDLARMYGYDLKLKIAADYKLVCQVACTPNESVALVNTPLCYFELGGVSTTRFWLGLKEQQVVRREVLGISRLFNFLIYGLKSANRLARGMLPRVYRSLRYVKGASA